MAGIDPNRANSSTVASEKKAGSCSVVLDVHANTVGGTKTIELVTDSGTRSVTALSVKDTATFDNATAPGEAGSSGETCVANTVG